MTYNFSNLEEKLEQIKKWLSKEFSSIRTNRATPELLDTITIDVYGSKNPLSHVAGIATEDARTLRITPWDKTQIKEIEKAITVANLGVSISIDDMGLRVIFPELTTERRTLLIKIVSEKIEKAKVSVRGEREHVWSDLQNQCRDSVISEDEKFAHKDKLQKLVDTANTELDAMGDKKEVEIMK
ncbi:MAG: ribosome recycling factor [Patescibacteria group bacterium]